MAEIKSTMDMVLERAARMAADAQHDGASDEMLKEGMRTGAAYLRGELDNLAEKLASFSEADHPLVQKGAVQALLRNIVLPRNPDQQEPAEKAMNGLVAVGQGDGQLLQVFGEMKKVLDGYLQHKEQLRQQLEDQFAQQMEMMEQNLSRQTGVAMKLQPAQHPKFQEEWNRLQTELNGQYGKALEQLKKMVEHILTK